MGNRLSKRNNVLKALAGTNWEQQDETLVMTYKALGRWIANYAAPVWSTNASESDIGKILRTQSEALRIITGSHNMSSIDHLHSETEMLQVEDHLNILSAHGTLSGYREGLSPHHQDGSTTKGNERDNFHQTQPNHVATASKQKERHIPSNSHLICQ